MGGMKNGFRKTGWLGEKSITTRVERSFCHRPSHL
jgi:hypothetical protein